MVDGDNGVVLNRRFPFPFVIVKPLTSKSKLTMHPDIRRRRGLRTCLLLSVLAVLLHPASAHASLFHGETLDSIANGGTVVIGDDTKAQPRFAARCAG